MSKNDLARLASLPDKRQRTIIGLMSGTSLDGLDIALCTVQSSGFETSVTLEQFTTLTYDDTFRANILEAFARRQVDLEHLTLLNVEVAEVHAALILRALDNWLISPGDIDVIASHGQTIYHAPRSLHAQANRPNATLQIGDPDHIARRTGIITCADFRQKHLAAGGEGAPLAAYGDLLLLGDDEKARILLNIGGIANITYLPPRSGSERAFSTDIGPGNTLMDAYMRAHRPPATFDEDAKLARAGTVHSELLAALKDDSFLAAPFPKTTGPEHFSLERFETLREEHAEKLSHEDALATLNRLSAEAIIDAIQRIDGTPEIYLSGGGAHNPLLREALCEGLPGHKIGDTSALGIDPDAKEAVLFAVLANELIAGDPETFRGRIDGGPAVTMGKISLPD